MRFHIIFPGAPLEVSAETPAAPPVVTFVIDAIPSP
jgi:hypothetical protein